MHGSSQFHGVARVSNVVAVSAAKESLTPGVPATLQLEWWKKYVMCSFSFPLNKKKSNLGGVRKIWNFNPKKVKIVNNDVLQSFFSQTVGSSFAYYIPQWFLPREATRSAVLPWQVVRLSVRLSVHLSVRL